MLNRVQRTLALCASQAAILLIMGSAVAADQTLLPSQACQLYSNGNFVSFHNLGAALTYSDIGSGITCGLGQDNALDTNDDVNIYFWDNNGTSTSSSNFYCFAYEVDEDWSSYVYTGAKYGCSTAGGCATDPGTYAASNYITLSDLQHGGVYSVALTCYIPANAAGGVSFLKSFVLDEQ